MEINLLNTLFVDTIDSSYIQNTVYESDNTDIEENNKLQTEYINKSKILSIPKKINNINNPEYDIYSYNLFIIKNL
tara:strand:+ start:12629 stop:12856 length:228 start_codon:yes stop_codon:yes gene_type:complete